MRPHRFDKGKPKKWKTVIRKNGFSRHSEHRISERSSLTPEDIRSVLECGSFIRIGQDSNRTHKLFWSLADEKPLVIVHDERVDEVVTVLYPDQHPWRIDGSIFSRARILALKQRGEAVKLADNTAKVPIKKRSGVVKINFICQMLNISSGRKMEFRFGHRIEEKELPALIKNLHHYSDELIELIGLKCGKRVIRECRLVSAAYQIGDDGILCQI